MIATTQNFGLKQADIELLQTIRNPAGVTPVSLTLAAKTPKAVAGIQKLLQRFVLLLLTRVGELPFDEAQGSDFLADILQGAGRSQGKLINSFSFALTDVRSQLAIDDTDELFGVPDPSEQLESAVLEDYSIDIASGTLYLSIRITTKAGDAAVYVIPTTIPRT